MFNKIFSKTRCYKKLNRRIEDLEYTISRLETRVAVLENQEEFDELCTQLKAVGDKGDYLLTEHNSVFYNDGSGYTSFANFKEKHVPQTIAKLCLDHHNGKKSKK